MVPCTQCMSLSADVIYNIWCHHKMWYWVCRFPSTYSNMAPNVSPRICKSVGMYLDVCKIWYTIDDAMSFKSFPSTYSNMTLNILLGYLDGSIFHTSIGFDYLVKVWQWQKKLRWKNLVKIGCTITMFYIQCVTWLCKGDFQTQVKIAVRMVYNITMFHIW